MTPKHGYYHIYIGPAALCPCPPTDETFLVISGDTTQKSKRIFEKRSQAKKRKKEQFLLTQGVVGQSGNEKNWYIYYESILNGIFPEKLIDWCNPTINTSMEASYKVRAEKLETFISSSNLSITENTPFRLIIAEGDPLLVLKRSRDLIQRCEVIDFSLHPLTLIWQESIDNFLSELNFYKKSKNLPLWISDDCSDATIDPCQTPSVSEDFLDLSLQALLRTISLNKIRKQNKISTKQFNELQLLKSLVVEKLNIKNEQSISELIRQRAQKNLKKLLKFYKINSNQSDRKASKNRSKDADREQIQAGDNTQDKTLLRGYIDGFRENLTLHGWVDASDFGPGQSKVKIYWEERNDLIGEALVNVERPDLLIAGIKTSNCGFCARLSIFEDLPIIEMLDSSLTLKLIETKSGLTIGDDSWVVRNGQKDILLNRILHQKFKDPINNELFDYLITSKNQYFLANIRAHLIKISSIYFQAGHYDNVKHCKALEHLNDNPTLDYGCLCESATRLELIFSSIVALLQIIDKDNVLQFKGISDDSNSKLSDTEWLNSQLQERFFLGLQAFENRTWVASLQPLIYILMSTILLQNSLISLQSVENLIKTLARLSEETYNNPRLAFQLLSIVEAKNTQRTQPNFSSLAQRMGDNFTYLVTNFGRHLNGIPATKNLFYYSALTDLSSNSLPLLKHLYDKQVDLIHPYLVENPRHSKPLHWLDRFGLIADRTTRHLISKMQEINFNRDSIIKVHHQGIDLKKAIAELLWNLNDPKNIISIDSTDLKEPKNWLIIGEQSLTQCWMYRVEQKKEQLIKLGYNVKTIDQIILTTWSFTHDFLWADAIIICRLAATYPIFRAISYARSCNKKVYYEIDDLIFTSDYPDKYDSYGNSISYNQYKNLCADYPLRQGVMTYADEVIVSTAVLAELYALCSKDSTNRVNVLPNLPLTGLHEISKSVSENFEKEVNSKSLGIIITSGTLSHKNILIETIFPILLEILSERHFVKLTVVGHINLPPEFSQYAKQIKTVMFTDYESYLNEIRSSSIALVPLEKHPTTDGKSAIKWMEASLCGLASICSPVKAYTDVAIHGETALFAETADQWKDSINQLIDNKSLRGKISKNSFDHAKKLFNENIGQQFWSDLINRGFTNSSEKESVTRVLLINVFFAPQSVGGATRIAQDYALAMTNNSDKNYEVTVLCTEYDHWHADSGQAVKNKSTFSSISSDYQNEFSLTESYWNNIRIIRLCMPPKQWSQHYDSGIEAFCDQLFKKEPFDLVQCHCCQILTAAPLVAAENHSIPYEIVMHDGWWMSPEQFLVSPAGVVIDPGDPIAHIDHEPNDDEKQDAYERRDFLYGILEKAKRRIAVSLSFKNLCEKAGIKNVEVQENKYTSMHIDNNSLLNSDNMSAEIINLCHIGGMSIHKGYQLLRNAVHLIPRNLPYQFTVIDHSLSDNSKQYCSDWNGYQVQFIAPVPMQRMPEFYASQDVLVAPSIWPESFGLVSREALSAGLWVIASDAGALAEPLKNSPEPVGSIVIPNDAQDLAKALERVPHDIKTAAICKFNDHNTNNMEGEV